MSKESPAREASPSRSDAESDGTETNHCFLMSIWRQNLLIPLISPKVKKQAEIWLDSIKNCEPPHRAPTRTKERIPVPVPQGHSHQGTGSEPGSSLSQGEVPALAQANEQKRLGLF